MKKIEKAIARKCGYKWVTGVQDVGRPTKDKNIRVFQVWGPNKRVATLLINIKSLRYRIIED